MSGLYFVVSLAKKSNGPNKHVYRKAVTKSFISIFVEAVGGAVVKAPATTIVRIECLPSLVEESVL